MKKLSVVVAGTGQIRDVEIQPGTTAGDILHQLGLQDYLLSKGPNEPFFAAAESVYDKLKDGEKVFASTKAEVGVLVERREELIGRLNHAARNRKGIARLSPDGDHGYVFVQNRHGTCIGCVFPDMADDDRYPCPATPAIADILQAVGALAVYAIDTLLMNRPRQWNYRRISLQDGSGDGAALIAARDGCCMFFPESDSHFQKGER